MRTRYQESTRRSNRTGPDIANPKRLYGNIQKGIAHASHPAGSLKDAGTIQPIGAISPHFRSCDIEFERERQSDYLFDATLP